MVQGVAGFGREEIYRAYVQWFEARAVEGAVPLPPERMPFDAAMNEDVYEDGRFLLNRTYHTVVAPASVTRSRRAEVFLFSGLHLIVKDPATGDWTEMLDLEYRVEG